jgi:hypothetical protein
MRTAAIVALILFVVGIALVARGIRTSQSLGSRFSEFFTGSPTDLAVWQILVGAIMLAVGLSFLLWPAKALRD